MKWWEWTILYMAFGLTFCAMILIINQEGRLKALESINRGQAILEKQVSSSAPQKIDSRGGSAFIFVVGTMWKAQREKKDFIEWVYKNWRPAKDEECQREMRALGINDYFQLWSMIEYAKRERR